MEFSFVCLNFIFPFLGADISSGCLVWG